MIATVDVNGNEVFRSEVLHEGLEGIPLTIQLTAQPNSFSVWPTPAEEQSKGLTSTK